MLVFLTPTPTPTPIPADFIAGLSIGTWGQIFSAIVALIALILSGYSFYRLKIQKFRGVVIPERRISLTWAPMNLDVRLEEVDFTGKTIDEVLEILKDEEEDFEKEQIIILNCALRNTGAATGKIEDIGVTLKAKGEGEKKAFIARFMLDEDIGYSPEIPPQEQGLRAFTTHWMGSFERLNTSIFFAPRTDMNMLADCDYQVNLFYSGDSTKMRVGKKWWKWWDRINWEKSPVTFTFKVDQELLAAWEQDKNTTLRLEGKEIEDNRKEFFEHN